jgi:hypothetical protein
MVEMEQYFLSFGSIVGDEQVHKVFQKYINEIRQCINGCMPAGAYGPDLEFILIFFHVEGELSWFSMPVKAKLRRYSEKDKTIRYDVPITKTEFFDLDEVSRVAFIIKAINDGAAAVRRRLEKKGLRIDFEKFQKDLNWCFENSR